MTSLESVFVLLKPLSPDVKCVWGSTSAITPLLAARAAIAPGKALLIREMLNVIKLLGSASKSILSGYSLNFHVPGAGGNARERHEMGQEVLFFEIGIYAMLINFWKVECLGALVCARRLVYSEKQFVGDSMLYCWLYVSIIYIQYLCPTQ